MKNNLKSLLGLLLMAAVLLGVWHTTRPEPASGNKDLVIQVIHGDGSTRTFPIETHAEYLGQALVEHGIVENNQSTYGLYILTADGETAEESDREWWCITKGGGTVMTGADETPVSDGETYELTLKVGYD